MASARFFQIFCDLFVLSVFFSSAQASSSRFPPINRADHISAVRIEVLPRRSPTPAAFPTSGTHLRRRHAAPRPAELRSDDSFLMQIAIPTGSPASFRPEITSDPDQHTWFTLFLHPTENFLHPQAKINYYSTDTLTGKTTSSTDSIVPEDLFAYSGWVIKNSAVNSWRSEQHNLESDQPYSSTASSDPRVIGWARLVVHEMQGMEYAEDLEQLVWEGSFEVNGQLWHVKALDSYRRIRGASDPDPIRWKVHPRGGLIAWRDNGAGTAPSSQTSLGHFEVLSQQASQSVDSVGMNSPVDYKSSFASTSSRPSAPVNKELGLTYQPQDVTTAKTLNVESSQSFQRNHLHKRQSMDNDMSGMSSNSNFAGSIGSTEGCPTSPKVLYIGIAADCTYVAKYGSQNAARLAILNNVNTASVVYERSFNVSLAIVEINMQNSPCPAQASADIPWNVGCPDAGGLGLNDRLSVFSKWRGSRGGGDGAGLWHLLTACPAGEEVGVAWLGTLCKADAEDGMSGQTTSGTGVTSASPNEWQVMAHEIGHNFGAIHDCGSGCTMSDSCCPYSTTSCTPDTDYIMTATSTSPASTFSPCSIGNICSSIKSGIDSSCLSEPGKHYTISLMQCGNGIVEPGEDCDPGQTPSPCCQWGVCKFAPGAVCDPTHSPCCSGCQYAPSGTICRPVVDAVCDQAEACTGGSAECPADRFSDNGLACGPSDGGLSCAAGVCTSRDAQCQKQDASLGLKKACDPAATMDCRVACEDPKKQGQCVILENTFFASGSPCGCGGFCSQDGKCVGGNKPGCGENWRPVSGGELV